MTIRARTQQIVNAMLGNPLAFGWLEEDEADDEFSSALPQIQICEETWDAERAQQRLHLNSMLNTLN